MEFLVVTLLIVVILTLRLTFKVDFYFDIWENCGHIHLVLFNFITVFKAKIQFEYYYFSLRVSDKKTIKIELDLQDKNLQFINDLQAVLASKIYLIYFNSKLIFGSENPFITAVGYGGLTVLNRALFFKLLDINSESKIHMNVLHNFTKNTIDIKLNTKFIVSFFDLVWAFMNAILNRRLFYNE